jgi:putative component of membrane protein insertase Oxa1/YidC/SpoIIIJ protein YidD
MLTRLRELFLELASEDAMSAMLRALVRVYRYFLAPLLPPACRFHPSCSGLCR